MPPSISRGVETLILADDGHLMPNSPNLALIIYRGAFEKEAGGPDAEARIIAHFAANGWSGAWVNGIYSFHHYHATVHEVLGIARGAAEVLFGGPSGRRVEVWQGDSVLIPAGVGHCRVRATPELSVVGAYPGGADWDLVHASPQARIASIPLIAAVPRPARDPIAGFVWPAHAAPRP